MNAAFAITYSWQLRPQPLGFDAEDYEDVSPLFLALKHFLSQQQGQFALRLDSHDIIFDLDPDLSTVFEEFPAILSALGKNTQEAVELYFYEQGTDLRFLLERNSSEIRMKIERGSEASPIYDSIPQTQYTVSAHTFLAQWLRFLRDILDALAKMQPRLIYEAGYISYMRQLEVIEAAL